MLFDYTLDAGENYKTILQQGVVLQCSMFQLFDLERNKKEWNTYPEFDMVELDNPNEDGDLTIWRGSYGVCDHLANLFQVYPELLAEGRTFVVSMTPIDRDDEPEDGGWRWHKWGAYIGTQKPTCEHLYDEPDIDLVYCYHIYEKVA